MTQGGLDLLVGALVMDGALPALRTLYVDCASTPGALSKMAKALAGGTSPLLKELCLFWDDVSDNDIEIIANMLEARASIPGCKRLDYFEGNGGCFNEAPLAIQIRLLHTLLPSIKKLPIFLWSPAFEPCFLDVHAPCLTRLDICFEDDGSAFSANVLPPAPPCPGCSSCPYTCNFGIEVVSDIIEVQ